MNKLVLAFAAMMLPFAASAATVSLDAKTNSGVLYKSGSDYSLRVSNRATPTVKYVTLNAGTYNLSPTQEMFQSWSRWNRSSNCDSDGANCAKGFEYSFAFFTPETITGGNGKVGKVDTDSFNSTMVNMVNQSNFDSANFFRTAELGFQAVKGMTLASFTLNSNQQVGFFIFDDKSSDNRGGVDINIAAVPLPAGLPLLLAGLGGLAFFRRRKV